MQNANDEGHRHVGRNGADSGEWICVYVCVLGQTFAFMKTTIQTRASITPEPSAAHSHLSTPISAACVLLSGLRKQDGA